jgi:hypothetical protein
MNSHTLCNVCLVLCLFKSRLGVVLMRLGFDLGASQERLASWGRLAGVLGASWKLLWDVMEASGRALAACWRQVPRVRKIMNGV